MTDDQDEAFDKYKKSVCKKEELSNYDCLKQYDALRYKEKTRWMRAKDIFSFTETEHSSDKSLAVLFYVILGTFMAIFLFSMVYFRPTIEYYTLFAFMSAVLFWSDGFVYKLRKPRSERKDRGYFDAFSAAHFAFNVSLGFLIVMLGAGLVMSVIYVLLFNVAWEVIEYFADIRNPPRYGSESLKNQISDIIVAVLSCFFVAAVITYIL